uniref:DNA helicase n=1 Tax=Panagrolaimus sp. JU765 TaxID=591449 RepID=A0AC34PW94_9BILA
MSSDDDYDDSSSDDTEKESVSEEAEDDEEEIDDDEDEVENDADETLGGTTTEVSMMQVDDENAETIEKILKERQGIPGATGPTTTVYNMEEKGDPNAGFRNKKPDELERQFLIKWVGWSHLHNTWESEKSLKQMNAKGMKKLDHYIRKQLDNALANRYADKEYMEYLACEEEMGDELLDEYRKVERVIAHQFSRDKNSSGEKLVEYYIKWSCLPYSECEKLVEYYIKWSCLPYSECTWEDEGLIKQKYGHKIEQYFERINSKTLPNKTNSKMLLRKRPKFQKLEYMPDFLKPIDNPEMELRDYQLEGLNWLLNAYCKENSCILADEMGLAWQREFELWAPKLNSVIYMGDASSREQIRQYELIFPNSKKIKINALLTTYELLLKDKSFLSGFDWSCLVIDEAHRLKNNESLLYQCLRNFNTGHRLLITGTPLQNSLKELWALLHFIMPEK